MTEPPADSPPPSSSPLPHGEAASEAASERSLVRRVLPLAATAVVTIAAIGYVASQTNFERLSAAFAAADYRLLPLFVAVLVAFYGLKAWRWAMLLRPLGRFGLGELWPSMMAGFAFNNLLPAHLGEFVRMHTFARQSGLSRPAVLSSIALERLFDVLAILGFLSFGLLASDAVPPSLRATGFGFLLFSLAFAGGAIWYVFDTARVVAITRWMLRTLCVPSGVAGKVLNLAELGAAGMASLRRPRLLLGIVLTSLAQWGINGGLIVVALETFGVSCSAATASLVLAAVAFGVTLPSTPGYFGTLQLAFVLAMSGLPDFESQRDAIVAASIYYHAAQWLPVTAVGLWGFTRTGGQVRQMLADKAAADSSDDRATIATEPVSSPPVANGATSAVAVADEAVAGSADAQKMPRG